MEEKKIRIIPARGAHAVYCLYDRQNFPQPAYIEIDPEEWTIRADYNGDIGGAVSEAEWNGRLVTISINPRLKTSAINKMLKEIKQEAEKICKGYRSVWDGNNYKGKYTPEAEEALCKIQRISYYYDDPSNMDMRI